jgi:hypothetical protein
MDAAERRGKMSTTTVEVRELALRMMAQLQGDDVSQTLSSPAKVEEFLRVLRKLIEWRFQGKPLS